ncbi:hypothetical protein MSPP1_003110 [Malassezia sp. CBS 17886]|nr:hypothetical protein MSPP1_003110 [Malassezia sp. CBS 17886]
MDDSVLFAPLDFSKRPLRSATLAASEDAAHGDGMDSGASPGRAAGFASVRARRGMPQRQISLLSSALRSPASDRARSPDTGPLPRAARVLESPGLCAASPEQYDRVRSARQPDQRLLRARTHFVEPVKPHRTPRQRSYSSHAKLRGAALAGECSAPRPSVTFLEPCRVARGTEDARQRAGVGDSVDWDACARSGALRRAVSFCAEGDARRSKSCSDAPPLRRSLVFAESPPHERSDMRRSSCAHTSQCRRRMIASPALLSSTSSSYTNLFERSPTQLSSSDATEYSDASDSHVISDAAADSDSASHPMPCSGFDGEVEDEEGDEGEDTPDGEGDEEGGYEEDGEQGDEEEDPLNEEGDGENDGETSPEDAQGAWETRPHAADARINAGKSHAILPHDWSADECYGSAAQIRTACGHIGARRSALPTHRSEPPTPTFCIHTSSRDRRNSAAEFACRTRSRCGHSGDAHTQLDDAADQDEYGELLLPCQSGRVLDLFHSREEPRPRSILSPCVRSFTSPGAPVTAVDAMRCKAMPARIVSPAERQHGEDLDRHTQSPTIMSPPGSLEQSPPWPRRRPVAPDPLSPRRASPVCRPVLVSAAGCSAQSVLSNEPQ